MAGFRTAFFALSAVLWITEPSRAAFSGSDSGTSSAQFLQLGGSARGAAMGDAFIAAADDASSVRYNPAAMIRVRDNSISFMHLAGLQSTSLEHLGYVRRFSELNAAGASLLYMNYGSIPETNENAAPIGAASPFDLAMTFAYARGIERLGGYLEGGSVGLSLSYVQSKIVDSASTAMGSIGFLSRPLGSWGTRVAFVAENLGGSLKYDQNSDPLPSDFKLGGSFCPQQGLLASAEAVFPRYNAPYAAAGAEKLIETPRDTGLALRAGFNTETVGALGALSGFSLGFGFLFSSWTFDYAFIPFGSLGITNRLSLSVHFGRPVDWEAGQEARFARSAYADVRPEPPPVAPRMPAIAPTPIPRPASASAPGSADLYLRHMDRAKQYETDSDYAGAAGEYRLAASAAPDRPEAPLGLGAALMASSNWNGASAAWSSAENLLPKEDPRRVYVEERFGATEIRRKELHKAETHYLKAAELAKSGGIEDANALNAYLGLAFTLGELGRTQDAIRNYRKVQSMTSDSGMRAQIDRRIRQLQGSNP